MTRTSLACFSLASSIFCRSGSSSSCRNEQPLLSKQGHLVAWRTSFEGGRSASLTCTFFLPGPPGALGASSPAAASSSSAPSSSSPPSSSFLSLTLNWAKAAVTESVSGFRIAR